MASGDKIYIADKETLDSVKSTVEKTNESMDSFKSALGEPSDPTSARPIFSYLEDIADSVNNTGSDRAYFTASDLINNKFVVGFTNLSAQSINVTGSGLVYALAVYIPYNNQSNNVVSYTIRVDNQIVASRSFTHAQSANNAVAGYLSKDSFIVFPDVLSLPGYSPLQLSAASASTAYLPGVTTGSTAAGSTSSLLYTPKPIRFNSSINVSGSSTHGCIVCYMYELD